MFTSTPLSRGLLDVLRSSFKQYVSRVLPGLLELLNIYCLSKFGKDVYELFLSSPCTLYRALQDLYRVEASVDVIFRLFVKTFTDNPVVMENLISYAKSCRDRDFLELLQKAMEQ